jgi:uncharacterized protein (DUF488 family)
MTVLFTVGHSTHSADRLRELLLAHDVSAVADVRSSPYSRMNPQFNRETLRDDLRRCSKGIAYVFLGAELGARTDDRSCYVDGKVQYDRLAQTALFKAGLDRVLRGALEHRVALLCAEKDPLTCHRCILVSRELVSRGASVRHILSDATLESHEDALHRLLLELGLHERDLFLDGDDLVAEAYRRRGEEIAYVGKVTAEGEPLRRTAR